MGQILVAAVFGFAIGMPLTLFIVATSRDTYGRRRTDWPGWVVRLALLSSVVLPAAMAIATGGSPPAVAFWLAAAVSPWACWFATRPGAVLPPAPASSRRSDPLQP